MAFWTARNLWSCITSLDILQSLTSKIFVFISILGISGCTTGDSGINFEDFRNAVAVRAGTGAIECSSTDNPNQCIEDSFQMAVPAYSVFESDGIDSQGGSGVALTSTSRVFFLHFDSDPSGGGSLNNGRITTRECVNPVLSGPGVGSFACE